MSAISTYEAVPNRIRSLVRIVAMFEPISRKELVEYLMPLNPKDDQGKNVIRETSRLGLITDDGNIRLSEGISKKDVEDDGWFLNYVERSLFTETLSDNNKNKPIAYVTAWILTRPVEPIFKWGEELTRFMNHDFNDEDKDIYDMNEGRVAMLSYWMRFTGYGESIKFLSNHYILPNPTRALARRLHSILSVGEVHQMNKFIGKMGKDLPVLETGSIRTKVESRLKVRNREPKQLSQSTSFALKQLELRGTIKMEEKSDAGSYILDFGSDGHRGVSQIELIGD